jgi:hypothetical protein
MLGRVTGSSCRSTPHVGVESGYLGEGHLRGATGTVPSSDGRTLSPKRGACVTVQTPDRDRAGRPDRPTGMRTSEQVSPGLYSVPWYGSRVNA